MDRDYLSVSPVCQQIGEMINLLRDGFDMEKAELSEVSSSTWQPKLYNWTWLIKARASKQLCEKFDEFRMIQMDIENENEALRKGPTFIFPIAAHRDG